MREHLEQISEEVVDEIMSNFSEDIKHVHYLEALAAVHHRLIDLKAEMLSGWKEALFKGSIFELKKSLTEKSLEELIGLLLACYSLLSVELPDVEEPDEPGHPFVREDILPLEPLEEEFKSNQLVCLLSLFADIERVLIVCLEEEVFSDEEVPDLTEELEDLLYSSLLKAKSIAFAYGYDYALEVLSE